jgi:hypothetical protein
MLVLALLMVTTAWADNVSYVNAGGTQQNVNATQVTGATTTMGTSNGTSWYYVTGDVTIYARVELAGTVNLILADGCNLYVTDGMHLPASNTLNIYAQSGGSGKLRTSQSGSDASIGGDGGTDMPMDGERGEDAGNINIYGGVIEVNGDLGGGMGGYGSAVVVGQDCQQQWIGEDCTPVADEWDPETGEPTSWHDECVDIYEDVYTDIYGGGIGGSGGDAGTICIYGGSVSVSGAIGGGYGGGGFEQGGSDGSATILLSWTNPTDQIYAVRYNGTLTLQKAFTDKNSNQYAAGAAYDIIDTKLLSTSVVFHYPQTAATCTSGGYAQDFWYMPGTQTYYSDEACTHEIAASSVLLPALGHHIVHHAAQGATFTTNGNLEYWQCDRCDIYYRDADGNQQWSGIVASDLIYGVEGNAQNGYSICMPKDGVGTLTIDNSVSSFKIYDDGGANGNYSNSCNSQLVLIAPENCTCQLTGDVTTEKNYDYLTVYVGTTTGGTVLLDHKSSSTTDVSSSIGTVYGTSMLLYFHSDHTTNCDGLDLTVTIFHNITLANDADNTALIEAANDKLCNVTLGDRTLYQDDAWNTICLPFDVDLTAVDCPLAGAEVRELVSASIDETVLNLTFNDPVNAPVTTLTAGTPYIIKWETGDNIVNPVFNGVTIDKTERSFSAGSGETRVRFAGTYDMVDFTSADKDGVLLLGANNKLHYVSGGACLGACRAYFKIGDDAYESKARSITSFNIDFGDGEVATGVFDVRSKVEETGTDVYDLQGRRVLKPAQKGLYIVNGKKVMINK